MHKKESYKNILPHFQKPGQAYFVTWCLKDAVPKKAFHRYTSLLNELNAQINFAKEQKRDSQFTRELEQKYHSVRKKYIKAYDDLLNSNPVGEIDLSKTANQNILIEALSFWDNKRLYNYAFCIMPNHVHWVFELFFKDESNKPVYLQEIMHSVKRFSATRINKLENRTGSIWQKESFDTTIRDEKHLSRAIEYTLNNPVEAGLVLKPEDWSGNYGCGSF